MKNCSYFSFQFFHFCLCKLKNHIIPMSKDILFAVSTLQVLTEKSTVEVRGQPGMPGLKRQTVSKWLKSFASEQDACPETTHIYFNWMLAKGREKRTLTWTGQDSRTETAMFCQHVHPCSFQMLTSYLKMSCHKLIRLLYLRI